MGCLVFGIYLSVTFLIGGSSDSSSTSVTALYSLAFSLYSVVPISRLLYITTAVDRVVKKAEAVRARLFAMESSAAASSSPVAGIRCVIRSYEGLVGFSACNFFTVNRGLVTSIVGYLVTYIIVLIQFKVSDVSE